MRKIFTLLAMFATLIVAHAETANFNFSVDMSREYVGSGDTVYLFIGDSWEPDVTIAMTDDNGDNIYECTYVLDYEPGFGGDQVVPYSYAIGQLEDFPYGEELDYLDCTEDETYGVSVRNAILEEGETVYNSPAYMFSTCDVNDGSKVQVIFTVDMSEVEGINVNLGADDDDDAYVAVVSDVFSAGEVQLWSEGDGIYVGSEYVDKNSTFSYYFAVDVTGESDLVDETVPAGCAIDGERQVTIGDAAYNIPMTKFGACSDPAGIFAPEASDFEMFPNPTNNNVTVVFEGDAVVKVYNFAGVVVKEVEKTAEECTFSVADLPQGVYMVACEAGDDSYVNTLQVK